MEMDTRVDIRAIVKRILSEYAAIKPSYGNIETETVFDDARVLYGFVNL